MGNKVLCRIPGMISKLNDSWEGPFIVQAKFSAVNYKVVEDDGRKRSKVVHINNLKGFNERDNEICALTVIAEEEGGLEEREVLHVEECDGYRKEDKDKVLGKVSNVLSEVPGKQQLLR